LRFKVGQKVRVKDIDLAPLGIYVFESKVRGKIGVITRINRDSVLGLAYRVRIVGSDSIPWEFEYSEDYLEPVNCWKQKVE